MVRVIVGNRILRKIRIQLQEFGNTKEKGTHLTESKNIMIYDDEGVIDLDNLHKLIVKTVKEYADERETLLKTKKDK